MKALITGFRGQDGYYLWQYLAKKGYVVEGIDEDLDIRNYKKIEDIIRSQRYEEIYNLAAISSFSTYSKAPIETSEINCIGLLNILEAVKKHSPKSRVFQASSSEMFGDTLATPQVETDRFSPRNLYGITKLFAHQAAKDYRKKYGLFVACGILYNHESIRRPEHFVTRSITKQVALVKLKKQKTVKLGNLNHTRDFGYAPDYVEAMNKILRHKTPDDFIIATGKSHTIADFFFECCELAGINPECYERVKELCREDYTKLVGNPSKIYRELGWKAKTSFKKIVSIMYKHDEEEAKALNRRSL